MAYAACSELCQYARLAACHCGSSHVSIQVYGCVFTASCNVCSRVHLQDAMCVHGRCIYQLQASGREHLGGFSLLTLLLSGPGSCLLLLFMLSLLTVGTTRAILSRGPFGLSVQPHRSCVHITLCVRW